MVKNNKRTETETRENAQPCPGERTIKHKITSMKTNKHIYDQQNTT